MDQSELFNKMIHHFNTEDRFCKSNGIKVVEIRPGYGRTQLTVCEQHLNGLDIVQGGAVYTLADLAFAAASNSHGIASVGMHTDTSFIHPGKSGVLTAEAREISRTRKTGHYEVEVKDEEGKLIAKFTGIGYFLGTPFPPEK